MIDRIVCSRCVRLRFSPLHFLSKLSGWHDLDH